MKQIISLFAVAALGSGVAFAQPGQMGGQQAPQDGAQQVATDADTEYSPRVNYFKVKDMDALATQRTQEVKDLVGLNDKEFKKVEAWMKKDIKFRYKIQKLEDPDAAKNTDEEEEEGGPDDGPMEGPGGMGGPGGGPGGMGGPGGGPGGMGGPGGGMGGPGGGPGRFGGSSSSNTGNGLLVVDQYYIEDTEAQLRKILKDERYEKYRAAKPAEEPYTKRSSSTGGWGGRGMMMGGPGGPM